MIVVIGDLLLDIYVLSQLREAEQGQGIVLRPGGSAANTAAWLAHLGSEVMFVGCVGGDAVGAMLVKELESHGVRSRIKVAAGYETGAVVIELVEGAERVMRSSRGANEALDPEEIRAAWTGKADLVHLTGYSMLSPYGYAMLEAAGELARRCSALLSFDPSSVGVIRHCGAGMVLRSMETAGVDLLLPNRAEAQALTGDKDPGEAAGTPACLSRMTIVKDGSAGATWINLDRCGRVPTEPVVPLDTTGAGDAFNAGAIRRFIGSISGERACVEGNRVAARVMRQYGGRPMSPTL